VTVAIVGGGLMGLALAERLSGAGAAVEVLEAGPQLGGLTTHHDYGLFHWDRFYHVILPSDGHLLGLLRDLELGDEVRWSKTLTGYHVDGKAHSLSTPMELARFPLLGPVEKARLAWTILYCSRIRDWRRLERVSVEDFLVRLSGRRTFDKFWKPLLLAKMGEEFRRVSAVFIWTYVKRMFSARDASASNEQLGHVSGGYRTVFDRLTQRIERRGGTVRLEVPVASIQAHPSGGLTVVTPDGSRRYDRVIFTAPTEALERVVDPQLAQVRSGGSSVEYLGVVCAVVVSRNPLTPYYVLNVAEPRVPFTGVIGMSNVVDPSETAGYHLTYLPRYVPSLDPLFDVEDDEIRRRFLEGARIVLPDLDSAGIVEVHVNRAGRVQPLQVMGYSGMVPSIRTQHDRLFVLNTAQFVSNTLNNNEVVRAVDEFMARHGPDILGGDSSGRDPTEVEGA